MFNTQSTSTPRLKNDTLGDEALKLLYKKFEILSDDEFKKYCLYVVELGGGKLHTKDKIQQAINSTNKKAVMLKKAQDFILAGMGLGV